MVKRWENCIKNIQSIDCLVHVTSVCDDCPRSVLLWLCLGVALVLLCCAANQYCLIVGDRVKNIAIALCDRSPNSREKHGQTKSTKNNQFYKITHLLCYFPCRVSGWIYLIFLGKRLYKKCTFYTSDNSHYVKWVLI